MNPAEWYKTFLNSRKLLTPSGIPLYGYKIAQREYITLMDVLKHNMPESSGWDSCFVLYATEWWRKFYEGGSWSWEPILQSINKASLSVIDRNQFVSSGFKKWKRSVNENLKGNDFIGTVVIECGLPFRVLESEHYLADIITDLYQELGAISSIESGHIELVRSFASTRRLPQALQKDAFFHLLLQFVTVLIYFNEKFGFSGTDKPVEKLDELSPGWREQFPLRVEGNIGKAFIDQLLTGITKAQEYQPTPIHVRHELVCLQDKWKLKSKLDIKAGLYKLSVLGISNTEFEVLSNKLEIYVGTSHGDQRISFAFKNHEMEGFYLDKISNFSIPGYSTYGWELYLLDPKNYRKLALQITSVNFNQNTEPLIFAASCNNGVEKRWELIATGTVRLKRGIYRVMSAGNAVLTSGDWRLLGNIIVNDVNFAVYEVASDIGIQQNDNSFYLTLSDETENFSYEPTHQPNGFEFYREENKGIYRGWPKIYKIRQDGAVIGQVGSGLEYLSGGYWARLTRDVTGKVKVRLTTGSQVLFCKTIQVVPNSFSVEFNTNEKIIHLLHSASFSVTVYSDAKTVVQVTADGHNIIFKEHENLSHDFFQIGLTPKDGRTDKILLKIPCPKQQLHFYSAAKGRLPYKASLYLHDLYGSRLYISNLSPFSKTYRLKLALLDPQQSEDISVYRSLKVPAYGNFELSLVSLKDFMLSLLAMTSNIDARILVSCDDKAAIEIRQFEFMLERLDGGYLQMKTSEENITHFDLQAFRLDEPFAAERVATLVYQKENNRWCVPDQEGIWFIYPAPGIKEQFRPLVHALTNNPPQKPINTSAIIRLHEVAFLGKEERFSLMDEVLDLMAIDCSHPDWTVLYTLYQSLQHLPLSSQDVFTRLSNHSSAIMVAALVLPEELVLRLSQEFAITWSQYSVDSWITFFEQYQTYLSSLIASHAEQAMQVRLDWIGHHLGLTSIKWVIEQLLFDNSRSNGSPRISLQVAHFLLEDHLNGNEQKPGLRARHQEERWPDQLSGVIINAFKSLPDEIRGLLPTELVPHQKSVIYLPFVLAAASAQLTVVKMPKLTPLTKFRIQEIISFDEEWFAEVYNLVQGYLLEK